MNKTKLLIYIFIAKIFRCKYIYYTKDMRKIFLFKNNKEKLYKDIYNIYWKNNKIFHIIKYDIKRKKLFYCPLEKQYRKYKLIK